MSKGNPLLGYSRGKVGDLVLTRGEGQQIMRARNRSPRNPKTQKQMYQRAIMATVMQAYKAGLVIFDHSFQGKKVGLENMKQFLSINAKKLRANIISDLAANTVTSSVVSPGAITPVPYSFRISEGTFSPSMIEAFVSEGAIEVKGENIESVSDLSILIPGDIYTIVMIGCPDGTTAADEVSPATIFAYVRLTVKQTLPTTVTENITFGELFDIETYNCRFSADTLYNSGDSMMNMIGVGKGACGVIHSRKDTGVRSTADMVCTSVLWGVTPASIPEVWNANVPALGQSQLILEGGDE